MRYLSDEWFVAADKALANDEGLPEALAGVTLTVEQTVTGGPNGTVSWHLVVDHGAARLVAGSAPDADIRFRTTYAVARDVARGRLAASAAFLRGDLSVGGDLGLLTRHQRALSAIDDMLGEVRQATDFGED